MNVLLSFNNMFKWGGPLDIKWKTFFWVPQPYLDPFKLPTSF